MRSVLCWKHVLQDMHSQTLSAHQTEPINQHRHKRGQQVALAVIHAKIGTGCTTTAARRDVYHNMPVFQVARENFTQRHMCNAWPGKANPFRAHKRCGGGGLVVEWSMHQCTSALHRGIQQHVHKPRASKRVPFTLWGVLQLKDLHPATAATSINGLAFTTGLTLPLFWLSYMWLSMLPQCSQLDSLPLYSCDMHACCVREPSGTLPAPCLRSCTQRCWQNRHEKGGDARAPGCASRQNPQSLDGNSNDSSSRKPLLLLLPTTSFACNTDSTTPTGNSRATTAEGA